MLLWFFQPGLSKLVQTKSSSSKLLLKSLQRFCNLAQRRRWW
jgi:hypothetical protein